MTTSSKIDGLPLIKAFLAFLVVAVMWKTAYHAGKEDGGWSTGYWAGWQDAMNTTQNGAKPFYGLK